MLIAFALFVVAATDGTWSDGAAWIEALSTVAAFSAALVAAVFVAKTVTIELHRERDRIDADRRAQAVLVAGWPERPVFEIGCPDGAGGYEEPQALKAVQVRLSNASHSPVTALLIEVQLSYPLRHRKYPPHVATALGEIPLPLLPPNRTEELVVPLDAALEFEDVGALDADDIEVEVILSFTDASNVNWIRELTGLREL
jgi:hypothetical protein